MKVPVPVPNNEFVNSKIRNILKYVVKFFEINQIFQKWWNDIIAKVALMICKLMMQKNTSSERPAKKSLEIKYFIKRDINFITLLWIICFKMLPLINLYKIISIHFNKII